MKHRTPLLICIINVIEEITEFIKINYLIKTKIKNMKRFSLLNQATQEKTQENAFKKVVANELRNFKKEISDLEFTIEEEESKLEERLANPATISKTEVLTMFANIKKLKEQQSLIESFVKDYYEG